MTRHTVVIEVPEGADPNEVEAIVSRRLRMTYVDTGAHVDGDRGYRKLGVAEFHHEDMVSRGDNIAYARDFEPES